MENKVDTPIGMSDKWARYVASDASKNHEEYSSMVQEAAVLVHIKKGKFSMKNLQIPLLLSLMLGFNAYMVNAQVVADKLVPGLTRAQVKMERDEFIKTHRYDPVTENWVLKKEYEPPGSMMSRAQVKAERDEFLRTHRYDTTLEYWVPLKGEPKSAMSREQVRAEAAQFLRTHEWDDINSVWTEKAGIKKMPGK